MIRFGNPVRGTEFYQNLRLREIDSFVYINDSGNWKFSLHNHENFCELIYIVSGKGDYVVGHGRYEVGPGMLILINPDVPHVQVSSKEDPLSLWNLSIQLNAGLGMRENMVIPEDYQPVLYGGAYREAMETCCKGLFWEMTNKEEGFEAMCFLWVEHYLWLVRRLLASAGKRMDKPKFTVEDVKRYIDSHYDSNITLSFLEEQFHMSRFHIVHRMREEFGTTPINYLIDRRMGAAQDLLNTTDLSITEIAARVGYGNANYFNKMFHKKIGMSPTEFRTSYVNIE